MPALNQAICWDTLYYLTEIGQSAGNLLSLNFSEIFRDNTLEFFCCITYLTEKLSSDLPSENYAPNDTLGHYLAGLIEADGTIIVPKTDRSPKGRLNYPSIQIIFDSRDATLALTIQSTLGHGSLSKKKGANAYVLTFNSREGILLIVSLINGKMRTPKIQSLYALIDWINLRKNSDSSPEGLGIKEPAANTIEKLPLNSEPLDSSPWLSGFIEGDGSFQVRATGPNAKNKYPKVECRFELCQSQTYYNGSSNYSFMSDIATFLGSSFIFFLKKNEVEVRSKFAQYRIRTVTLASNIKLENYLDKFPLFSSKYLNYKDWVKVLEFKKIAAASVRSTVGTKYDADFLDKVVKIRNGMNNKRTIFVWDHLQGFYRLRK